jgi:hypothetical protein
LQLTEGPGSSRDRHLFVFWPLNEPENKEVSAPTAARTFRKLEQSSLYNLEHREGSPPTAAGALSILGKLSPYHTENKEVSIPTTAGTESRLGQSSLHDPENQEASVPSAASVVRTLTKGPGSSRDRQLFVVWYMQRRLCELT